MWQLPHPVSITGTRAFSVTERISPRPPRGISTSRVPRIRIMASAEARDVSVTSWTQSSGRPAVFSAARRTSATAALERTASLPPRSSTALPAFRQMAAASAVTLGRAS